jgi:iron(III) transport system substrate-binding protein
VKSRIAVLLAALCASLSFAQAPAKNDEVFRYRGADRDARLVERAKQEGQVVLYTSLAPTESKPLAEAFEKKYGIKVELWRALSDKVVQRVITEAQGSRHTVDVVETNGPEMEALAQEKLLAEIHSPYLADLPADGIPPHRSWFPTASTSSWWATTRRRCSAPRFPPPTKASSTRNGRAASASRRPTANGWRPS